MATGREMQLTKQMGEYLVCAQLARHGWISAAFSGNVPDYDIITTNIKLQSIPVQVKAIKTGSLQFDGKKFLNIKFLPRGKQKVESKNKIPYPNLIWVIVKINGQNQDEFYICRMKDVQNIVYRNYKEWLSSHGGKRPRSPESTHCAISFDQLEQFQDKWILIDKSMGVS